MHKINHANIPLLLFIRNIQLKSATSFLITLCLCLCKCNTLYRKFQSHFTPSFMVIPVLLFFVYLVASQKSSLHMQSSFTEDIARTLKVIGANSRSYTFHYIAFIQRTTSYPSLFEFIADSFHLTETRSLCYIDFSICTQRTKASSGVFNMVLQQRFR